MTSRENASGEEAQTTDAFLGGLVTLVQLARGHRAGLDAALLQALVPATQTGHAVDLGTGVGTVALCVAARAPSLVVTGIERDASLIAMGREALRLIENAEFAPRITLIEADAGDPAEIDRHIGSGQADWVLMNPPFDDLERAPPSPVAKRRRNTSFSSLSRSFGMICVIDRPIISSAV